MVDAKPPVLVTGGSGFVGTHLVGRLGRSGFDVHLLRRSDDWSWSRRIGSPVHGLVHLAARTHILRDASPSPLAAYREANVDATRRLAERAAAAGVRRFVFVSSAKVHGERTLGKEAFSEKDRPSPADPYAQSKLEAELLLREYASCGAFELTIVRPPLVYGPGVKGNVATLANWIAADRPLPLGAINENERSMIAMENLVDLLETCITHPAAAGSVFLASDGAPISTAEFVRRLARALGRSPRLVSVPVWMLRTAGSLTGRQSMIHRLTESFRINDTYTQSQLDWYPVVTMDESLASMRSYEKEIVESRWSGQ